MKVLPWFSPIFLILSQQFAFHSSLSSFDVIGVKSSFNASPVYLEECEKNELHARWAKKKWRGEG